MNEQQAEHIAAPVAKTVSMWATIAAGMSIQSWADAASFATFLAAAIGALYSFLLVAEWFWKKLWRPLALHWGWIKPKHGDTGFGGLS